MGRWWDSLGPVVECDRHICLCVLVCAERERERGVLGFLNSNGQFSRERVMWRERERE